MYLYSNHIFPFIYIRSYIKTSRNFCFFIHPDKRTVNVVISSSLCSIRTQKNFFSIPISRQIKFTAICSCRIPIFRNIRRVRFIPIWGKPRRNKFVRHIHIDRHSKTLTFPIARNYNIRPFTSIKRWIHKIS